MTTSHPIPSDSIRSISDWHALARPEPDARAFSVQLGCHIEEFVEMLRAMDLLHIEIDDRAVYELEVLAANLKLGKLTLDPHNPPADSLFSRTELLDSLCDQTVTAAGVAHCAGMDYPTALAEVNRSNWSKFENGSPVFLPGGKIGKGQFYTPPDLTDFV